MHDSRCGGYRASLTHSAFLRQMAELYLVYYINFQPTLQGGIVLHIYLAVTPSQLRQGERWCRSLAHVAYSIGSGSQLLRNNLLMQTRGGLLTITDRQAPRIDMPEALCAAALRECGRRNYSGVLADFEEPPTPDRQVFLEKLAQALRKNRRALYVPRLYGTPGAVPLLCTAVSGGNFRTYLQETISGGPVPALDLQRVIMDFPLPSPLGEGTPLTQAQLAELRQQKKPAIFFSPELCAKYFTYAENGKGHFILFDDASTLQEKLRLAAQQGVNTAFLQYPEVEDLLPQLFGQNQV